MISEFRYCPLSRVVEELPPEETSGMSLNGWMFTSKPKVPYRPTFKVTLHGLRWRLTAGGTQLDLITEPDTNAGNLRLFYIEHRLHRRFAFNHEYLGPIYCKFAKPVTIPAAVGNSGGLIQALEVQLIHDSPSWN